MGFRGRAPPGPTLATWSRRPNPQRPSSPGPGPSASPRAPSTRLRAGLLQKRGEQPHAVPACSCSGSVTPGVSDSATPWAVARQAPLSVGFSRQGYWSGMPCPPPGGLPSPGLAHCPLNHPQRPPRLPEQDPIPGPLPTSPPFHLQLQGLLPSPCLRDLASAVPSTGNAFPSTLPTCLCPLLQALSSSLGERPHSTSPIKTLIARLPQLQVP